MSLKSKRKLFHNIVTKAPPVNGAKARRYKKLYDPDTPHSAIKTPRQRKRGKNAPARKDIPSMYNPIQISVSAQPKAHKINVAKLPPTPPRGAI